MKPPAFQFYAAEYLADEHVQLMSLEEEGAYIRLLAFCWREGSIPSDLSALSRLCKGASTTVLAEVVKRFEPNGNEGRLVHLRLESEREKQSQWREKSAQGGRASAHKRKQVKGIGEQQGGSTKGQAGRLNQEATLRSSSSSSSSSSTSASTSMDPTHTLVSPRAGVCVKSKFSLEQNLQYAKASCQTDNGIKQPDAWAAANYANGLYDEMVEAFLRDPEKHFTKAVVW